MPEYSDYLEGLTPSGALTGPEKMGMSQSGAAAGWTPALMAEYLRSLGLNPYTFPFPQFTTATSTTAYTGTPSPAITAYATGQKFQVKVHATSTGLVTLNLAAIGAKKVFATPTTQATTGDLVINSIYLMFYDAALDGAVGGFLMVGGVNLSAYSLSENTSVAITDAASMDITGPKHTLTTSSATRTFTQSYTGDYTAIVVTLNAAASVFTFPAGALCVSEGTASGDNTLSIAGVSGDKYFITISKYGTDYYVVAKNFGQ